MAGFGASVAVEQMDGLTLLAPRASTSRVELLVAQILRGAFTVVCGVLPARAFTFFNFWVRHDSKLLPLMMAWLEEGSLPIRGNMSLMTFLVPLKEKFLR